MIQITEKRKKAIIDEVIRFIHYDKFYTNAEWLKYVEYLKLGNHLEHLIESTNSFELLKMVLQYMYSHVNDEGELARLYDVMAKDEFIQTHRYYFERLRRDFIHLLITHSNPLFFIDVDDTLTYKGEISKEKKEYIRSFSHKDNIVLSTGKLPSSLDKVMDDLALKDNYACCLNGSVIYHQGEIEVLNRLGIVSKELSKKLLQMNVEFVIYDEKNNFLLKEIKPENVKKLEKVNDYHLSLNPLRYENAIKILIFNTVDVDKEAEQQIREMVASYSDLIVVRTGQDFLEIMNENQNKGVSVFLLSEKLNHYYRDTVGVGDSMNDYAMLTYTGKSYIVSTASEEMKSHDFAILEEDRDKDIVNLLKKYEDRTKE